MPFLSGNRLAPTSILYPPLFLTELPLQSCIDAWSSRQCFKGLLVALEKLTGYLAITQKYSNVQVVHIINRILIMKSVRLFVPIYLMDRHNTSKFWWFLPR